MSKIGKITRRSFLIGSVVIAGGAAFGYYAYKKPYANPLKSDLEDGEIALTPYVLINQSGITVIAPRAEMGQGVYTTLAALVAEELDVELEQVQVIHGPASKAYFNEAIFEEAVPYAQTDHSSMAETVRNVTKIPAKFLAMQITGGSSSIPDAFVKMRTAGASVRETLKLAAARKWEVDPDSLATKAGRVVSTDGKSISYEALALDLGKLEPVQDVTLKPKSQWRLLGKSLPRVDMVSKSTGTAQFGVDIDFPNMLYATVRLNPCRGCGVVSYNAEPALAITGVKKVLEVENGLAVLATNTWYAFQGAKALKVEWQSPEKSFSTEGLKQSLVIAIEGKDSDSQHKNLGDVDTALSKADKAIEAEYFVPYLAHAAMEPMNATALVREGKLEVWAGNQLPTQILKEGAEITGFDEDNIRVHTPFMGGGFGRRAEIDFAKQAIHIALAVEGTPVKLTWTREEDTTQDYYRPMAMARVQAGLNDKGPIAVDYKTAAPSVVSSQMGRLGVPMAGPDISIVQAAWDQPYDIENYRVTGYKADNDFPVSSWRSVGASQNAFFHESFLDECAHAKGLDPMQMRIDLISHLPSKKVLQQVADMSKWFEGRPENHGLGVAFSLSFGVPTAEVVEVVAQDGKIRVVKAWAAVDVGTALDPRNIEAQVMSGMNFGLAAAMMSEVAIEQGKVQQSNFHNYNSIRIHQAPDIEVAILENADKIRGIGEPGTPPAAPALANAIFAATGQRIRELPLNKHVRFA